MSSKLQTTPLGERETIISCRNSQGSEVRATPVRLTRFTVVFEVYNPFSIVQLSEVLSEFRITVKDRLVYHGRGIVSSLVNTGIMLMVEATLEEAWLDVDLFQPAGNREQLLAEFTEFLAEWRKIHFVTPEFKVVVADMQTLLADLRRWMEQVELGIRSAPGGDRARLERNILEELGQGVLPTIHGLFQRFESIAGSVDPLLRPMHRTYIKRQLHPLVLCSPFAYRTFQKPLGYAGDYEMVNMILRDPLEGGSLFAKTVNLYFLNSAPALAHRNRIKYLVETLSTEARQVAATGRRVRILNLGCGPAGEIQQMLATDPVIDSMEFTLLDFNDETLEFTQSRLERLRMEHNRSTPIQFVKKSVHQVLKEGSRPATDRTRYEVVYCAGLFDYLSDRICQRLMNIFYDLLEPGGLLIATNVDPCNPTRCGMEFILDWHLIYRDPKQLLQLHPTLAPAGNVVTKSDDTGVNIYIEVRKPAVVA